MNKRMIENNPNQDPLQARLYQATVAPPEHVWTNIEATLRRRRRRVIFWWFLAGAGLAGLLAGYWHFRSEAPAPSFPAKETPIARTQPYTSTPPAIAASPAPGILPTHPAKTTVEKPVLSPSLAPTSVPFTTLPAPSLDPAPAEAIPARYTALQVLSLSTAPLALPGRATAPPTVRIPAIRKKKETTDCYDFQEHPNAWLVDVYAGPVLPGSERQTADSEFTNYVQQLNATETPGFAFQAGLRTSLLFKRHWLLRTGLDYEQRNTTFEYADPNYIEYTVKVRTELINGVWQTVTDTVGVEYGEHYQKVYNRYGTLDIPLMAGYEWRRGRTGVNVQAGASLNVLFWKRGSILSPQGNPAVFTPSEAALDVYRPRIGASLTGSIQWFWHLQPRLRVFAEPYYRQVLQPVTLGSFPVEQRYSMMGLRIGLTKILN